MFNWLGNIFPYSDLHSLNLDWILSKMKETAAQAAKAVADAANALAQVAEAKAAALSAQTAAQNAQTAANNAQTAADNAADSAEHAVTVAQNAQTAAQNAQTAANNARTEAQNAQTTAADAHTLADGARTTAETAQTAADNALARFPVKGDNIARHGVIPSQHLSVTYCPLYSNGTGEILIPNNAINPPDGNTRETDISHIADVITFSTSKYWNLGGEYLQIFINLTYSIDGVKTEPGFDFSFIPSYFYRKDVSSTNKYVLCVPFTVMDKETLTLYKGNALLKRLTDGSGNTTLQLVFESMPPFKDGTKFTMQLRGIKGSFV